MKRVVEYLVAVKEEMVKVTWPSKDEVVQATTLVISFALALAVLIYAYDFVIGFVLKNIFN